MLATGDFVSLFGFLEQFKSLGVLPRCVLFSLILTFIILAIMFRLFGFPAPKDFKII
jgi:hypothetical protein